MRVRVGVAVAALVAGLVGVVIQPIFSVALILVAASIARRRLEGEMALLARAPCWGVVAFVSTEVALGLFLWPLVRDGAPWLLLPASAMVVVSVVLVFPPSWLGGHPRSFA